MTLIVSYAFINFSSRCYNWIQQHSVSEGTSSVSVTVSILSGILTRNAYLIVDNRDGSAQGNFKFSHFKLEMKVNHALDVQSHPML